MTATSKPLRSSDLEATRDRIKPLWLKAMEQFPGQCTVCTSRGTCLEKICRVADLPREICREINRGICGEIDFKLQGDLHRVCFGTILAGAGGRRREETGDGSAGLEPRDGVGSPFRECGSVALFEAAQTLRRSGDCRCRTSK